MLIVPWIARLSARKQGTGRAITSKSIAWVFPFSIRERRWDARGCCEECP
jgi:hypothetical protein